MQVASYRSVSVVDLPFGKRPFRVHIDPAQDGAEIVNGVADRVRTGMYRSDSWVRWRTVESSPSQATSSQNRSPDASHISQRKLELRGWFTY
jgi:hypothetical protein